VKHCLAALTLVGAMAMSSSALAQSSTGEQKPLFHEPRFVAKTVSWIEDFDRDDTGEPEDGLYPDLSNMITGAGWISGGPGYRHHLFDGNALVDVSAAISWRAYKTAHGLLEFPHLANKRLTIGSRLQWQDFTQIRYFGLGPDTLEAGVSDYRMKTTNVVGYATWRLRTSLSVSASTGWLQRPSLSASGGSFDRGEPETIAVYVDDPAVSLETQPQYLHGEIAVTADTRNHPSYPTSGVLVRGAWSTYHDRSADTFTFDRYEGEAAAFMPVERRGVIAAHFWGVFTDTADDGEVPFYLMPSLGGHNTLRGYPDYRFHDRNVLLANLEWRWALIEHVETAAFFDVGNVAARADDLNFARKSYGFGFRLHTSKTTIARFDVARSDEEWRFLFKLSDPLRLARIAQRAAAIPFVP
jgi:outer membrane protein assembly factor BamA